MPIEPQLSLFERILLASDGTVTDLLALYADESIRVVKLEQRIDTEVPRPLLQHPAATTVLNRRILLVGAARRFIYADSQFLFERLPATIQQQLIDTDRPIGLLWKEARLETYREIVIQTVERDAMAAQRLDLPASTPLVSRTYVVHHGGRPLGVISEKWPAGAFP